MTAVSAPPDGELNHQSATAPSFRTSRRRRGSWLIPLLLIAIAVAAVYWWSNRDAADSAPVEDARTVTFADVVRTDLIEQSTYTGTLGRVDPNTISSRIGGTITAAPAPGTTLAPGDTLFEVDGQPIVLLEGTAPAWRPMSLDGAAEAFTGNRGGTVTATVEAGTVVTQGDMLYAVDTEPITALFGATPAFRTMRDGVVGPDVLQLETALAALGYDVDGLMTIDEEYTSYTASLVALWETDLGIEADGVVALGDIVFIPEAAVVTAAPISVGQSTNPGQAVVLLATGEPLAGDDVAQLETALASLGYDVGTVDDQFDAATREAVIAWQTAIGAEPDGIVDLGEVIFGSGSVRVSDLLAPVGASVNPGGNVLAVTSEATVVAFDLAAEDQGVLTEGLAVDVELPDGEIVPAAVTSVSTVASAAAGAGGTTFPVEIVLDDPAAAGSLEGATVDVLVLTDSVQGAVAVPVTALVALAEGGYAVEVEVEGGTRLVGVEPGFFADGLVEVIETSLTPGDRVVVP